MTIGPLPVGAKAWFTPPIVPVGLDSTLHIATFNVTPGTYQVTVEVVGRAVQGGGVIVKHSAVLTLVVTASDFSV